VSATDGRPITYRLEVSDAMASTTFDALNVLVATAASVSTMPATVRLESTDGTMVGAMVADGDVERVALLSADGSARSSVSYTATQPSGRTSVHVIVDLVPSASYIVSRDGVVIATVAASSQGVLTFSASEGGRFAIQTQSASAPGQARSL